MPSAFICGHGLAAGLELLGAAAPGAGPPASPRSPRRRRARTSAPPRSSSVERRQRERRQRLVEREVELQVHGQPHRAAGRRPARRSRSTTPAGQQRPVDRDRPAHVAACGAAVLVVVAQQRAHRRERVARRGRCTFSSIEWLTRNRETSGSGSAVDEPLERLVAVQVTKPSGAFLRCTLRRFFGVVPALASGALVLDDVLRRLHDDVARRCRSRPGRPARRSGGTRAPSAAAAASRRTWSAPVSTTVRIGTLMPTPRVSVPQMTFSSPAWASCSTSRRYFGSIPAWCTPIPCRTSRESVLPKPAVNRKPPMQRGDRVLLGPGAHVDRHQRLGPLERGRLGEVDDVDRRLVGGEQLLERLVQRRQRVRVRQRHGPLRRRHHGRASARCGGSGRAGTA